MPRNYGVRPPAEWAVTARCCESNAWLLESSGSVSCGPFSQHIFMSCGPFTGWHFSQKFWPDESEQSIHGFPVDGWARQSRPGDRSSWSSGRWLGSSEQARRPGCFTVSHLLMHKYFCSRHPQPWTYLLALTKIKRKSESETKHGNAQIQFRTKQ